MLMMMMKRKHEYLLDKNIFMYRQTGQKRSVDFVKSKYNILMLMMMV